MLYNWSDYLAPDTLAGFTARSGITALEDVYDDNEQLDATLRAVTGRYDVVVPTARPFAGSQVLDGLYRPLDKGLLPGFERLDPAILADLAEIDPDNAHLVPYLWGTSGLGINPAAVADALGDGAAIDTWGLIFDYAKAARLARCGISLLDDATDTFGAALVYLGRDPNSSAGIDIAAAAELLRGIRRYVRYFHSSRYARDLADGELCVAQGYSGDILQARARARADRSGRAPAIEYVIPREGAPIWVDVLAIPRDAPNPDAAHALIAYLLDPLVIAAITNHTLYANANLGATPHLARAVREDPAINPPQAIRERLFAQKERTPGQQRRLERLWERIKQGR